MDRSDIARRVKKWKLSMKSLLCSICNVTVVRRRKIPRWENMDRDILAKIFEKLNVVDIIMGASQVCISWFLVAHQKSLWKTINLTNLQRVDLDHPRLQNMRVEDVNVRSCLYHPRQILIEISKFSSTSPTNLFFNFYSYIRDEDLIIAAERMPNIKKVAFPRWCDLSENSYQFAFIQWKDLHTLIISPLYYGRNRIINFRVIGENCKNLTNLKFSGYVNAHMTKEIVYYLPKLKRLSMRCCVIIDTKEVFSLIACLENLATLNLSHCVFKESLIYGVVLESSFIKTVAQKISTNVIMCEDYVDFGLCEDQCRVFDLFSFGEKHWRNDEIVELQF